VLKPETIAEMVTIQPGASDEGLAYGVTDQGSSKLLQHFGGNDGWAAFFSIDTGLREGLVLANNSSNGFPLNAAVQNLWLTFLKTGGNTAFEPEPSAQVIPLAGLTMLALAGLIAVPLMVSLVVFILDLRAGRRIRANRPSRSGLVGIIVWAFLALFWIYWFYTTLPLPFPPAFTDLWRMPQTDLVTIALLAWGIFRLALAWFPKKILSHSQQTIVSAGIP
jgi:hypothetical protein